MGDEKTTKITRADTQFWDMNRAASRKLMQKPIEQYVRYAKWYRGELDGGGDDENFSGTGEQRRGRGKWSNGLNNYTSLATRMARAELFYRNPRFLVRPPSTGTMGGTFTPALAHVESEVLNAECERIGLYREGRRSILDALLGPFGVLEVGYRFDEVIEDIEEVQAERVKADEEGQRYILDGTKPTVKDDDLHSVHISQHDQVIAAAENGDLAIPKKALAYLKKHRAMHVAKLKYERPSETLRNDSVFVRRESPVNLYFDPRHNSPDEWEWVIRRYLAPIEKVRENEDFDREARSAVAPVDTAWGEESDLARVPAVKVQTADEYCLLYDVYDLKCSPPMIRTYAEGGTRMLQEREYALAALMPSGPFIIYSFMEDPFEGVGVPPPSIYEAHQLAATYLCRVNTRTVQRSTPKILYNAAKIDLTEREAIKRFNVAGIVPLANIGPGERISDQFSQSPVAEIPAQNMAEEALHVRRIEQMTGLGSAKLGGGDTSKTATASAIVSESTSTLAEDQAAVLDAALSQLGRYIIRLIRQFYTKDRIMSIVGDDAFDVWPDAWSTRDIANDRNVMVVPGSTRRNSTAVEQKLLTDAYSAVAADPMMPPQIKMELFRRLMETMGIFGLDYSATMAAGAEAAMAGLGGGMPPMGALPTPGEEPAIEAMQQGVMNVGGGRLPTGASVGDNLRMTRGGPQRTAKRA